MVKRVFLVVIDSFGIGGAKDADKFYDAGSNTLQSIYQSENFSAENLTRLGLFNINGINFGKKCKNPIGSYARAEEKSAGKDSTIGHWEIAGIVSNKPLPTFPNGFPKELITKLENAWGRKIILNKPYSGTQVLTDYGQQHLQTGEIIVYTSGDSVLQIACHSRIAGIEELYKMCEQAREICQGEWGVGRIIARPFDGEFPNFKRTAFRKDFSLNPPSKTILNKLSEQGLDVLSVGKINALFNGFGITQAIETHSDQEGMLATIKLADVPFNGLCFVNLVDSDTEYGHRNNTDGYAENLSKIDELIGVLIEKLTEDDMLIVTADHGCDPKTESTDHSRENVPVLIYQKNVQSKNLGTLKSFAEIGKIAYNALTE